MSTTTIRVDERTHQALRSLAEATGEPMSRLVAEAVARLRADEFFAAIDRAYERLDRDPAAVAEVRAERELWEATLADGLEAE